MLDCGNVVGALFVDLPKSTDGFDSFPLRVQKNVDVTDFLHSELKKMRMSMTFCISNSEKRECL